MRISENKKSKLYAAIHDQIMELRIEIKMAVNGGTAKQISADGLDTLLCGLTDAIWSRQKDVLNIKP